MLFRIEPLLRGDMGNEAWVEFWGSCVVDDVLFIPNKETKIIGLVVGLRVELLSNSCLLPICLYILLT